MNTTNRTLIRPSARTGFTLVELLVVIGIIALLIGILLPTLSRARGAAKDLVCLSNMRQQGMGIVMYTEAHKGILPYGYWDGSPPLQGFVGNKAGDWGLLILSYLNEGAAETNYEDNALLGDNHARTLFRCPEAITSNLAITNYSAHHRLMPNLDDPINDPSYTGSEPRYAVPYKVAKMNNSSAQLLVADGTLQNLGTTGDAENYAAASTLYQIDEFRTFYDHYSLDWRLDQWRKDVGEPEASRNVWGGDNTDSPDNWGNLRYRHGGNNKNTNGDACNILYGDGHAEAVRHGGFFDGIPDQLDTNIPREAICVPSL